MSSEHSAPEQITIATANTHFGDVIRVDRGLDPLKKLKPDILLLQEVINPTAELKRQLGKANYTLVHTAGEFGLAMALRVDSGLRIASEPARTIKLQQMAAIERNLAQRFAKRPHGMNEHGMQTVKFKTKDGHLITAVNTRVTVPSNHIARRRQVAKIGKELEGAYYTGLLILGGDMNHFPGPQQIDKDMYRKAGLRQVDLSNEPTWRARNSKLYRAIARVRRQSLEDLYAQLDALLYRGEELELDHVEVVDTVSDHRAIIARFQLNVNR